jgi:hypothetical protein
LEQVQRKVALPAMVGHCGVLQKQDWNVVGKRMVVETAGVNDNLMPLITDEFCNFNTIPLQAATREKAHNGKGNAHRTDDPMIETLSSG